MDSLRLLVDLQLAIDLSDIKTVEEIFMKKSELLTHPHRNSVIELLLLKAVACNNDEMRMTIVDFLECVNFEGVFNLEKHLRIAMIKGRVKLTELLLKKGTRLDGPEWDGRSPASYLLERFDVEREPILLLLVKYGLNMSYRNEDDRSILMEYLKDFAEIHEVDETVRLTEILINSGISVNDVDGIFEITPLHCAVDLQNIELVALLINKGANVNAKSAKEGITPLYVAAYYDRVDIIDMLLRNGAEVNVKTFAAQHGWTPLHRACFRHHDKVIDLLLQKCADVCMNNAEDMTPFSLLNRENDNYRPCMNVMIKEFARLTFEDMLVAESDINFIKSYPNLLKLFEKFISELNQMANTKFYCSYSYHYVLKMSKGIKKLAFLTKNEEFVARFQANFSSCKLYRNDLVRIFAKAQKFRDMFESVESRLKSAFGNLFPDTVIRILAENLTLEDSQYSFQ